MDATNLYLAVTGPTVPFNAFFEGGPFVDNDQGDLFIAIDTNNFTGGFLQALNSHNTFGGVRAVDFNFWDPDYVVGVLFVDNGGGGGGFADLVQTPLQIPLAGEAQNLMDGGFDWHATINPAAAYDTFNNNAGEFEFTIPWTTLGFPIGGPPQGDRIRLGGLHQPKSCGFRRL